MEPRNRWLIIGGIAALLGLGYLYYKSKSNAAATAAAATQAPTVVASGTPTADLSTAASIPETGFNAGNFTPSGYNGLGAAGSGPNLSTPIPGFGGITVAQWNALTPAAQQLVAQHFSNPANQPGGAAAYAAANVPNFNQLNSAAQKLVIQHYSNPSNQIANSISTGAL